MSFVLSDSKLVMKKQRRMEGSMINLNNKKTKKTISAIIIVVLVLAMVAPMVVSAML